MRMGSLSITEIVLVSKNREDLYIKQDYNLRSLGRCHRRLIWWLINESLRYLQIKNIEVSKR